MIRMLFQRRVLLLALTALCCAQAQAQLPQAQPSQAQPQVQTKPQAASQAFGLMLSSDISRTGGSGGGLSFSPAAGLLYQVALPETTTELRLSAGVGLIYSLDLDLLFQVSEGFYAGFGGSRWNSYFGERGWSVQAFVGAHTPKNRGWGAFAEAGTLWVVGNGSCDTRPACLREGLTPAVRAGTLYRF